MGQVGMGRVASAACWPTGILEQEAATHSTERLQQRTPHINQRQSVGTAHLWPPQNLQIAAGKAII